MQIRRPKGEIKKPSMGLSALNRKNRLYKRQSWFSRLAVAWPYGVTTGNFSSFQLAGRLHFEHPKIKFVTVYGQEGIISILRETVPDAALNQALSFPADPSAPKSLIGILYSPIP
jgi:hypothetical protein